MSQNNLKKAIGYLCTRCYKVQNLGFLHLVLKYSSVAFLHKL